MKLYADAPARRARQVTGDLLVAGWLLPATTVSRWWAGDPGATAALAALELRALGLLDPAGPGRRAGPS